MPTRALRMLEDATPLRALAPGLLPLPAEPGHPASATPALMPRRSAVWSAGTTWPSSSTTRSARVSVSYWMNRLQNLPCRRTCLSRSTRLREPDPRLVHAEIDYAHPVFDRRRSPRKARIGEIQGHGGCLVCRRMARPRLPRGWPALGGRCRPRPRRRAALGAAEPRCRAPWACSKGRRRSRHDAELHRHPASIRAGSCTIGCGRCGTDSPIGSFRCFWTSTSSGAVDRQLRLLSIERANLLSFRAARSRRPRRLAA